MDPTVPVIVLTGYGSIELAVQAVKQGADQFLTKPAELPDVKRALEQALDNRRSRRNRVAVSCPSGNGLDPFVGSGPAIRTLAAHAQRIANSDCSVLILGETGSGKSVLARWLHQASPRRQNSFVDINCAGFARELLESELFGHEKGAFTGAVGSKPGLFEVAHRGTVFLDEIGDMEEQLQPKLLKVLEERRYRRIGEVTERQIDARFITATHQDLGALVRQKKFRADLYYRINTVVLTVPSLRERADDIPLLAQDIAKRVAAERGRPPVRFDADALEALRSHSFAGNIRELRNLIERAIVLFEDPVLSRRHLQLEASGDLYGADPSSASTLEEMERTWIKRALLDESGHVGRAAARLGISRSSLYQKLKLLSLGTFLPSPGCTGAVN